MLKKCKENSSKQSLANSMMAMVTFPIAIGKLAIALVQGYLACINLGMVDVAERAKAAEDKKKSK